MASTGFVQGSSTAVFTAGDSSWTNPTRMLTDSGNYATNGYSGGTSDKLKLSGFGLTTTEVPAGSTIDGIEVRITNYSSDDNAPNTHYYQLHGATTAVGSTKSPTDPIYSWTTETLGGAADTWSASLTAADVIDTDFGVVVWSTHSGGYETDYISLVEINVHYTEGTSDTEVLAAAEALAITEYAATIALAFGVAAAAEALTITPLAASITSDVEVNGTYGPNLVSNGEFTSDTTGWTAGSGGTIAAVGGQLEVTVLIGDNIANGWQLVSVESGETYLFKATKEAQDENALWGVSSIGSTSTRDIFNMPTSPAPTSYANTFVASTSEVWVQLWAVNDVGRTYNATAYYDHVEMRKDRSGEPGVSLALTAHAATVTLDKNVGSASEALTITPQAAAITLDEDVGAATEGLTLTPLQAGVTVSAGLVSIVEELALTTYAAIIGQDLDLPMATEGLTITGLQAQVGLDIGVSAAAEGLLITTAGAQVGLNQAVAAASEALSLTTYQAGVVVGAEVDAAVAPLLLSPLQASIDIDLVVGPEALTITGQAATIDWQIGVFCVDAELTITPQGAAVAFDRGVNAETKAITITTHEAAVLGEVISTSRRADPFADELSWNVVDVSRSDNLAEPANDGSNTVTASPADDNEVEV